MKKSKHDSVSWEDTILPSCKGFNLLCFCDVFKYGWIIVTNKQMWFNWHFVVSASETLNQQVSVLLLLLFLLECWYKSSHSHNTFCRVSFRCRKQRWVGREYYHTKPKQLSPMFYLHRYRKHIYGGHQGVRVKIESKTVM